MTYPHRIRLGEPWKHVVAQNGQQSRCRSFHCPTGLEDHEQVWLIIERVDQIQEVRLNESLLGQAPWESPSGEFDISTCLAVRNQIEIRLASDALQRCSEAFGPVRLEIRLAPNST